MKTPATFLALFVFAVLIGFCAYSVSASYYLASEFKSDLGSFTAVENTASVLTYGIVVSTDASSSTMVFSSLSPITGSPRQFAVTVTNETQIDNEALQINALGIYVGLSPLIPGSLSDLVPGTRVAVIYARSGNGLVAKVILFGDPL